MKSTALQHLIDSVEHLERELDRHGPELPRVAVFDLDNTLLIGDIGEAAMAKLIQRGAPIGITWRDYQRLLKLDPVRAYCAAVRAMSGLTGSEVLDATSEVMTSSEEWIELFGERVPIPRVHPILEQFVFHLNQRGFRVCVCSASNQISVRLVCHEWFGIASEDVFGIDQLHLGSRLTANLVRPIPIGEGKVRVLRERGGVAAPLITASDGKNDVPLLRATHHLGFSVWVGQDNEEFESVRSRLDPDHNIVVLADSSASEFKEEAANARGTEDFVRVDRLENMVG